ncbi:MAG: P-loop NTPase fold protein [Terriglobales bacterium]
MDWRGTLKETGTKAGWLVGAFGAGALAASIAANLILRARLYAPPQVLTALWLLLAGVVLVLLPYLVRFLKRLLGSLRAGLAQSATSLLLGALCGVGWIGWRLWAGPSESYVRLAICLIAALALFAVAASVRARPTLKPDAGNEEREAPISNSEEDLFGLDHFIDALASTVLHGPNTVVALAGALGSGKSSALNLLDEKLRKEKPEPVVVRFSPWLPPSPGGLATALTRSIASALSERFVSPSAWLGLRSFARAITVGAAGFWVRIEETLTSRSQDDDLRRLANALARLPVRLVVLLDEIDRMDKAEINELFKIIRGAPGLNNVCFVCALDPETVAHVIRRDGDCALPAARDYLEKFIGIRFSLPLPAAETRCAIVQERLGRIFSDQQEATEAIKKIELNWEAYSPLFPSPRSVKTLLTAVKHLKASARGDVHPLDALNLMALWNRNPAVVAQIAENWAFFAQTEWATWSESSAPGAFAQSFQFDKKRPECFETLLGSKDSPVAEIDLKIVCRLFPAVKNWRKNLRLSRVQEAEAKAGFRIYHPRYTLRYLTAGIPGALISDKESSDLVHGLTSAQSVGEARDQMVRAVRAAAPMRSVDLLTQIHNQIGTPSSATLEGVALAMGDVAPDLQQGFLGSGGKEHAIALLFLAIERLQSRPAAQAALLHVIASSPDEEFAAAVLFYCTNKERNNTITNWSAIDVEALKQAFGTRISARYKRNGSASLFERDGGVECGAIYRWAECGPTFQNDLVDYLNWEFDRDPMRLGRFLLDISHALGHLDNDSISRIEKLYPNQAILLKRIEAATIDKLGQTEEQRKALTKVRDLLAQSGPPPDAASASASMNS